MDHRFARLSWRVLLAAAVVLTLEILALAGLSALERRGVSYRPILGDRLSPENRRTLEELLDGRDSPFELDSVLGWTLRPHFRSSEVTIDGAGRRRSPTRPPTASAAVRLAAFGDSFTFGGDVVDHDAYPEALARLDAGIEVANYGVPAYGLDQAFLRYAKENGAARPQIVVIGYLSENICRNVSVFRPFYNPRTVFPLAKPRYVMKGSGLRLVANPLPREESYRRLLARPAETLLALGRNDGHYRTLPRAGPLDRSATVRVVKLASAQLSPARRDGCYGDAEALAVTRRLFRLFYETVLRDGAQPVILIFPTRQDVTAWRSHGRRTYAPLLRFLEERNYRFVDAMEVFDGVGARLPIDELIPSHLTPLANTLVARHLRQQLQGFDLLGTSTAADRLEPRRDR